MEVTVTEGSSSQTITLEGDNSATIIFGEDKTASITSTFDGETSTDSGTWSATGNKLTLISTEETTNIIDYSISGNILTIVDEYDGTADGEVSFDIELNFAKQ